MTDEAHRSQYADLATSMRRALPFQQSIDEGATVPLFYEYCVPEMQLANPNFD